MSAQREIRKCGHHMEDSIALLERDDIVRQNRMAALSERSGESGFSRSFVADERDGAIFDHDRAGVQASDATQAQQQAEHGAEQVGSRICQGRRVGPARPNLSSFSVQPELCTVGIIKTKKCPVCDLPDAQRGLAWDQTSRASGPRKERKCARVWNSGASAGASSRRNMPTMPLTVPAPPRNWRAVRRTRNERIQRRNR